MNFLLEKVFFLTLEPHMSPNVSMHTSSIAFSSTFTHNLQTIGCILAFYIPSDFCTTCIVAFSFNFRTPLWLASYVYVFKHTSRLISRSIFCAYFRQTSLLCNKLRYKPGAKLSHSFTSYQASCLFHPPYSVTALQCIWSYQPRLEACMRCQERSKLSLLLDKLC